MFAGNVSRQCSGSISEGGMWKDELDLSSCETTLSDISRELCEITLVSGLRKLKIIYLLENCMTKTLLI